MEKDSSKVRIGSKIIGSNSPCYIIAEAGSNHNGNLDTAFKLIDIAANAGADAVKFQSVTFETLTSDSENTDLKSAVDQITLTREWLYKLKAYSDEKGISFMSTPTYETAIDDLVDLGVDALKIASMDLTNIPLLRYAASKGKPIILSRGMSDMSEIDLAVSTLREAGCEELILLHCVANYPTAPANVNLRAMKTLGKVFDLPVGFSDHTESEAVAAAAASMGASVIEKHFTYDRSIKGFDHYYSLEPEGLARMIKGIRETEDAMGSSVISLYENEIEVKGMGQRSIVAKSDINAGEIFSVDNLTTKRPGTGIHPRFWDFIIGRQASRDLKANKLIENFDIA